MVVSKHMDADQAYKEKATNYIVQIRKATPHQTAAVQPCTSIS